MTACLVCLLEEPSAREMLQGVLPKLLPETIEVKYIIFEGKQDLDKNLARRLKYWQRPHSVFLVLRDKDSGDCIKIKQQLAEKVVDSGKQDSTVIRIACSELESFYLGDLKAVGKGLDITQLAHKQQQEKYRFPDQLNNAAQELMKLTEKRYQKVAGSRKIAPLLEVDKSNRSHSFNALLAGIEKLISKIHKLN